MQGGRMLPPLFTDCAERLPYTRDEEEQTGEIVVCHFVRH